MLHLAAAAALLLVAAAAGDPSGANGAANGAANVAANVASNVAAIVKTGDIVLITSTSPQAKAIAAATRSPFTHTGVVVVEDGKPFVYEAAAKVQKTALASFLKRAKPGSLALRRVPDLDDARAAKVVAAARAKLGTPYDLAFSTTNDALYCSEYVRVVFAAAGVDVGAVEHVRDLDVNAQPVRALIGARWKMHPVCKGDKSLGACLPKLLASEIVTPASIANDTRLESIDVR